MEQYRQVGEVIGSMTALMVIQDEIPINKRQCCLLFEIISLAFSLISASIRQNLRLEEKNTTKWKALEQPLRELHRVFREAEVYIRQCMDSRDWWAKVLSLHQNNDCIEFHVHNLLCNFIAVVESIETAGEISGVDPDEMHKKGIILRKKYDKEWNDPKVFVMRFGEQYLLTKELCKRFDSAWREDRWLLSEAMKERRKVEWKNDNCLGEFFIKKLNLSSPLESSDALLFPSSVLIGSRGYQVRRRLGSAGQFKEIQWRGESFMIQHLVAEIEPLKPEIRTLLSLSHPNIHHYLCGFCDEEKKECFMLMELMSKDLLSYIKKNSTPRRKNLLALPVIVDLLLQIARGMEYLHSNGIFHGDLNPKNVLLQSRSPLEGYFLVKITGFGLSSCNGKSTYCPPGHDSTNMPNPFIWHAPEVLARQGTTPGPSPSKTRHSEKADVYSFAMICFELLTEKVPFEDGHLQGDNVIRNIKAGERPLFPFSSPKFMVNLTKKCWATDPASRPNFSSICRVLRYIKKFLVANPEYDQHPQLRMPSVDFCDIENGFQKKFLSAADTGMVLRATPVSEIPFQMFSYRIAEIERSSRSPNMNESTSDAGSNCKEENLFAEDHQLQLVSDTRSVFSDFVGRKLLSTKRDTVLTPEARPKDHRQPREVRSVYSEIPEKKVLHRGNFLQSKTEKPYIQNHPDQKIRRLRD
ncbi:hypothetical protein SAY87_031227 [Trapa incisa]|uniref:Protein kinase domain-containing protein n=1 Tax=Trapa incisa TaxID=236973 RepID=A0AAN7KVN2_9MYRT|nr:hypothetical protein SAY87_031227 [Trapa incisa]